MHKIVKAYHTLHFTLHTSHFIRRLIQPGCTCLCHINRCRWHAKLVRYYTRLGFHVVRWVSTKPKTCQHKCGLHGSTKCEHYSVCVYVCRPVLQDATTVAFWYSRVGWRFEGTTWIPERRGYFCFVMTTTWMRFLSHTRLIPMSTVLLYDNDSFPFT
jgi:hypothetical protein